MKLIHSFFIVVFLCLMMPTNLKAQDFVYKPTNPSFGGNPYNYNWLLSSATQQNKIVDPNQENGLNSDPLDDFAGDLNRQILNQLSSGLVTAIFGENGAIEAGSYVLGNYQVDISEDGSGMTVNITDMLTGNYSNVVIPNY